jgi:hypothetical protein
MLKIALALITATLMTAALAANVHFKQNRNPTLIDNGLSLTAAGSLAGLGEGDIAVTLSASGTITATCTNPSGQNQPPGQVPQPVTLSGSVAIPDEQFKNGNVGFSVTTTPPDAVIAGAPDCPNSHWTERITDIKFTSMTLTVQQGGVTVLSTTCTTSAPTQNGPVSPSLVSCTPT